jgi:phage FluMu protein Com
MATSFERIRRELAYLRGMTDGGDERDHRLNPQVFNRLVLLLDEWLEETEQLSRRQEELEEYVEAIDEDLNDLEKTVYEEEDLEEEDAGYLKVECPKCREDVWVDEDVLDDDSVEEVICPDCRTVLLVNREEERDRPSPSKTAYGVKEGMEESRHH